MLMTIGEVAKELRVSKAKVRDWIDSGLLRVIYLPGTSKRKHARVKSEDLESFLSAWKSNSAT